MSPPDTVDRGLTGLALAALQAIGGDEEPATLDHLVRTLVPKGWLHVATDHEEYWSVIEPLLEGDARFVRQAEFGGPAFPLPTDGPLTNYEEKYGREGRARHRATWRVG